MSQDGALLGLDDFVLVQRYGWILLLRIDVTSCSFLEVLDLLVVESGGDFGELLAHILPDLVLGFVLVFLYGRIRHFARLSFHGLHRLE